MTGCSNKFAVNLTWQMCRPAPDQRPKIPESGLETWLVALGNKPARFRRPDMVDNTLDR
jgi:hypothetical protein